MSCDLEKLERHVAGELDGESTRALVAHAMGCADCRAELTALQRERALFAARAEGDRLDPPSWDRLAARLYALPARPPAPSRRALLVGGAVAAAASLMFVLRSPVPTPASLAPQAVTASAGATRPEADQGPLQRHFPVGDRASLRVELVSGNVHVRTGAKDAIAMAVGAVESTTISFDPFGLSSEKKAQLDPRWKIDARQDGDRVTVEITCPGRHCDDGVDLSLIVPSHAALSVKSISADVTIDAGDGAVEVETISGDLEVSGSRAITLRSTSGDIDVDAEPLRTASLHTVSGDVRARGTCARGCALTARTVSGEVTLRPGKASAFSLHYGSTSGTADDRPPPALEKLPGLEWKASAKGLDVACGSREGKIAITTISGDLSFEDGED